MATNAFDVTRKFVRVIDTLPNGLIEFEFAIGDPELAAELVMPKAAFEEFCAANKVELLGASAHAEADTTAAEFEWNLRQATHQRFR
jgi:phenol hydroxylase P0 protein